MDLSQIRFGEFAEALMHVLSEMKDLDSRSRLLDAARDDTPVICGMLHRMELLEAKSNSDSHQKENQEPIIRDLMLMLALRHIQQSRQSTAGRADLRRFQSN